MKKTKKQTKAKSANKPKKAKPLVSWGSIDPQKGRVLVLAILIIFACTILIAEQQLKSLNEGQNASTVSKPAKKVSPMQKEIASLVQGYPMQQMLPYISQQDPKVAAFMVAIAKKESAWGIHHPVLNGQDCYNYWGFRLKSEKMGSGGHTCFDSPQQAVETVASRIDELVNQEKIDSPKDMIVWKCGYACENSAKTADEQKWIKDVDLYYSHFANYL